MSASAPSSLTRIDGIPLVLDAVPLTWDAFAPFGEVIANPHQQGPPSTAVPANQGTAIKMAIEHMQNLCARAPSAGQGAPAMSMFVCKARELVQRKAAAAAASAGAEVARGPGGGGANDSFFPLSILERHPFTSQVFIPLGVCSGDTADRVARVEARHDQRRYLVIVAPSLPEGPADAHLPIPAVNTSPLSIPPVSPLSSSSSSSSSALPTRPYPGRGLPDLRRLRAFVGSGAQGVSYGAGTWHSPMAALGPAGSAIDFVVVQHNTGVPLEDCQEVEFGPPVAALSPENAGTGWDGVLVRVPAPELKGAGSC